MRGQTDLRTMKKRVNNIENQGENWYKMLQNEPYNLVIQITDFGEKLHQLQVKLSLEINVIEANQFVYAEGKATKKGTKGIRTYQKMRVKPREIPYHSDMAPRTCYRPGIYELLSHRTRSQYLYGNNLSSLSSRFDLTVLYHLDILLHIS